MRFDLKALATCVLWSSTVFGQGSFVSPPILSTTFQSFTTSANSTYTPNVNLLYAIVECVGQGGGGGGAATNTATGISSGGGGGAGSYSRVRLTATQIGASQAVTNTAAANGGTAGANAGTGGNDTSLGSLCVGKGGSGGGGAAAAGSGTAGAGGVVGTGDLTIVGQPGFRGFGTSISNTTTLSPSGAGGAGPWGGGAAGVESALNANTVGTAGTICGGGGSGGQTDGSGASVGGGQGGNGCVLVTEYNSKFALLTPPVQAVAAGYTRLTFDNGFDSIDRKNTQAPNFSWYIGNWFGIPASNVNNISVDNNHGVLTLGNGSGLARLVSALANGSGGSGGYVGSVFGDGGYFEVTFSFKVGDSVNAEAYPAFFLEPIEHIIGMGQDQWPGQAAGYLHFAELDVVEINHAPFVDRTGRNDMLLSNIDWSGIFDPMYGFIPIINLDDHVFTPSITPVNWANQNKYGLLWVKQVGATPGYVAHYFNNELGPISYYLGPVTVPPLPGQVALPAVGDWTPNTSGMAAQTYDITDSQRFAMRLETDPAWPIVVSSVKVWQR